MSQALRVALLILAASSAQAGDVAPDARRLLEEVARTYRGLESYADRGEVTLTFVTRPGQAAVTKTVPARVALARPGRVAIDAGVVRLISDGKTLRTITPPFANYRDVPATARLTLDDFSDGPLGAVEAGGPQGRPLQVLIALLFADDAAKGLLDDARSIRATTGGRRGPTARDRIDYEPQVGPSLVLWLDPATRLIDRIEVGVAPKDVGEALVPNSPLAVESLAWDSGPIETKAAPADAFRLVKPEGYGEIAQLARDEARTKAEHELVGQAAPEFSLTVLDGPGKTRRVRKADLAGKVVLLDFWATWCGPCLAELPDIERLIGDYAKGGKPVAVVAVSVDKAEDGDPDEVRALVEKTLKAKEIGLPSGPLGLVALDPTATVASAYKATAIPQLVLIDAKGVVRHVHIGVTGRDVLTAEIDALLKESSGGAR